jgi:excisionase family DNA binding protein
VSQQATIAQAAQHLGVSPDTIRRYIRQGKLPASKQPTLKGRVWLVDLPDDARAPAGQAARENGLLREEVSHWRDLALSLRQELAARTQEVRQLLVLLERYQDQLFPPSGPDGGPRRGTNGH